MAMRALTDRIADLGITAKVVDMSATISRAKLDEGYVKMWRVQLISSVTPCRISATIWGGSAASAPTCLTRWRSTCPRRRAGRERPEPAAARQGSACFSIIPPRAEQAAARRMYDAWRRPGTSCSVLFDGDEETYSQFLWETEYDFRGGAPRAVRRPRTAGTAGLRRDQSCRSRTGAAVLGHALALAAPSAPPWSPR